MFWLEDVKSFLLDYDNYYKIIPLKGMDLEEQMNSIMRFSIILSLVFYMVSNGNFNVFALIVLAAFFTIVVYSYASRKDEAKENLLDALNIEDTRYQGKCVMPTEDNPTMNILPTHYKYFPNRPPACDTIMNQKARESMNKILHKDGDDAAHVFYTMPCTVIPDDREKFIRAMTS
jgi:hypothetical protein